MSPATLRGIAGALEESLGTSRTSTRSRSAKESLP